MSKIRLQVGEWYKRRDGRIVGPVTERNSVTDFRMWVGNHNYTVVGRFMEACDSDADLIEHIPRTDPRHPEYAQPKPQLPVTVQVSIEVPAPPEGWRVDGWRLAQQGEMQWLSSAWRERISGGSSLSQCLVAVRTTPHWEPPSWLAPGWVAVDDDSMLWWWKEKPQWIKVEWCSPASENTPLLVDGRLFRDFTPPPIKGEHAIWQIS